MKDDPTWQRRTRHFGWKSCELTRHGEPGAEEETEQALAKTRQICREAGLTVSEAAIKWSTANEGITCTLVGARNARELQANVRAVAEPLAEEIIEKLNMATAPLMDKLGPSFDYYENTKYDRTR